MDKTTLTLQDGAALDAIKQGVNAIYEPVRRTMGPECGTTLMYRTYNRGPRNVDDGYYTAEIIVPKNPFVRLAAEFFKEGIKRTNQKVGDGTTTTAVIAGTLFNHVYSILHAKAKGYGSSGSGVMSLKKDILSKAQEIKALVRAQAKPVETLEELEKVSAISLGENSDLSKTIAKIAYEVGTEGHIDVVEGFKGEVETEVMQGMRLPMKPCAKAFINVPARYEMVIEDAPVLITNQKLDNDPVLRFVIQKLNVTKLLIIAPDFSDDVLTNMVLARQNGIFLWPVKSPSLRTEQYEDLAIYCGATFVDAKQGKKLEQITTNDLGFIERIVVKDTEAREDAVIRGGRGAKTDAVKERISVLKGQLEETREEMFKKLLERRIASMGSAVAVIRVGSPTEAEALPLKLKIEDDVYACKAALKSGYVKGGGLCLKEIADTLPDDHILKPALLAPHKQIQDNAGGNLVIGEDVLDPTDAVYYALEHATSVVASLITVKNLIPEEPLINQGEGEKDIANAIRTWVYAFKKKEGLLSESEKEAEKDRNNGLTNDEMVSLDNG